MSLSTVAQDNQLAIDARSNKNVINPTPSGPITNISSGSVSQSNFKPAAQPHAPTAGYHIGGHLAQRAHVTQHTAGHLAPDAQSSQTGGHCTPETPLYSPQTAQYFVPKPQVNAAQTAAHFTREAQIYRPQIAEGYVTQGTHAIGLQKAAHLAPQTQVYTPQSAGYFPQESQPQPGAFYHPARGTGYNYLVPQPHTIWAQVAPKKITDRKVNKMLREKAQEEFNANYILDKKDAENCVYQKCHYHGDNFAPHIVCWQDECSEFGVVIKIISQGKWTRHLRSRHKTWCDEAILEQGCELNTQHPPRAPHLGNQLPPSLVQQSLPPSNGSPCANNQLFTPQSRGATFSANNSNLSTQNTAIVPMNIDEDKQDKEAVSHGAVPSGSKVDILKEIQHNPAQAVFAPATMPRNMIRNVNKGPRITTIFEKRTERQNISITDDALIQKQTARKKKSVANDIKEKFVFFRTNNGEFISIGSTRTEVDNLLDDMHLTMDNLFQQYVNSECKNMATLKMHELNIMDLLLLLNKFICNRCDDINVDINCSVCGAGGHVDCTPENINFESGQYECNNCCAK